MGFLSSVGDMWSGSSSSDAASVWSGQQPYLTDLYQRAQDASYGGTGQQYAQQFQQPALGAFNQQAAGGQQYDTTALQQMTQPGAYDQYQNQQDQNLQGAIGAGMRQINQNFQENIMPGINTGAALSGTSGGSRQGIAQGIAARGANQTAADFTQKMQSQAFNQNQQRNLQAQQAGAQQQLGAYQGLGQQGAMANQAQQAAMGQAPQLSNLGFGSQYGDLQNLSGLIGGPTVLGGGSQTHGGAGDAIQGGAGALMAMFSDERLKENINKVGVLDNGLNVYTYNYKGSNMPQMGCIAQEVAEVIPSAVEMIDGYLAVNYSEIV